MFQTEIVEKFEKRILCSVTCFSENRAVYEVMWVNIVVPDRPQMTIRRMRIACWIPKARDIHSEYVILSVFAHQKRLREGAKIFRLYVNCLVLL